MRITKAIILVAGWGTRRLPVTKVIEKCMLPVGNRPLIDFVVEDCQKAGISDIFFVVSQPHSQIEDYYSRNDSLERYLRAARKEQFLPSVTPPPLHFHYIVQDNGGKYGTAVPVSLALPYLEPDESVVVLTGDDFIYNVDGTSETARLITAAGANCALLGARVQRSQTGNYGVLDYDKNHNFIRIVERPAPDEAPSTLINVSKYVLNYQALQLIRDYTQTERDSEYYIIDPINQYVAAGGVMKILPIHGRYCDGGNTMSWLKANEFVINNMMQGK